MTDGVNIKPDSLVQRFPAESRREVRVSDGLVDVPEPCPDQGTRVLEPVLASQNPTFRRIIEMAEQIASSMAPVFIAGESGTGKEVLARLIHARSPRVNQPLVAINCAALPKDVIDNELFGHEREAFTGASSKRPGCFEQAHGATLFLDEVAEMHPASQAKLLRVLETKSFRRLGGKDEIEVDVRVIAATNKDTHAAIAAGALRADLYYRLGVIEITIPPLRERTEDIPLLADYFLAHFCGTHGKARKRFAKETLDVLTRFPWPGNIRELKNLVESLTLMCPEADIMPEHLPSRFTGSALRKSFIGIPLGTSLEDAKRMVIEHTLMSVGNNKSQAAKILGVSRKSLYNSLGRESSEKEEGPAN